MSIWKKDTTQVSMATREKQRNAFLIFAWNEVENWEETRLKAFVLTIKPKKGKYIYIIIINKWNKNGTHSIKYISKNVIKYVKIIRYTSITSQQKVFKL